jgi:hypothetical protein
MSTDLHLIHTLFDMVGYRGGDGKRKRVDSFVSCLEKLCEITKLLISQHVYVSEIEYVTKLRKYIQAWSNNEITYRPSEKNYSTVESHFRDVTQGSSTENAKLPTFESYATSTSHISYGKPGKYINSTADLTDIIKVGISEYRRSHRLIKTSDETRRKLEILLKWDGQDLMRNKLVGVIVEIDSDTDIFIVLDGEDELTISFIQAQRQLLGKSIDMNKLTEIGPFFMMFQKNGEWECEYDN